MSFLKSIFKPREAFGLYKGNNAFSDSFSDQISNMFSFAAPQKPFKAASEDDIWKEVNEDLNNAVRGFDHEK